MPVYSPAQAPDSEEYVSPCSECDGWTWCCERARCTGPLYERTSAITSSLIDGSRLLLASVTAESMEEAEDAARIIAQDLSYTGTWPA